MSQTTYQVILSTDGKHTVLASTDDQAARAKEVFSWAKATYDRVVEVYGLKKDQYKTEANGNGHGETVPLCAIHKVPMVKVDGKHGPFWSCHERSEHGNWCSYKPNGR